MLKKNKLQPIVAQFFVWLLLFSAIFSGLPANVFAEADGTAIEENTLSVFYEHTGDPEETLYLWHWGDSTGSSGDFPVDGETFEATTDETFTHVANIPLKDDAKNIGFLIALSEETKLTDDLAVELISPDMDRLYVTNDGDMHLAEPVSFETPTVRVHYLETEKAFAEPGLWFWGDTPIVLDGDGAWPHNAYGFTSDNTSAYGYYVDVPLNEGAESLGSLIVDKADGSLQSGDFLFEELATYNQIFIKEGIDHAFNNPYYVDTTPVSTIPDEQEGTEDITVTGEVSRAFHYDEHALLEISIDKNSDVAIASIRADVSALGINHTLNIDPFLQVVTLSVSDTVSPGVKNIPITVVDANGGTYHTDVSATVVEKTSDARDWDESIIYFMLTDRFYDGDPSNNNPYDLDYENADNPRGTYQGGDFKGVTEKLDYLDTLGINTIWITPIVENVGHDVEAKSENGSYYAYHGYWAKDFETLNPHLGTMEDFHELIDEAAARNIDIMVDVVLNHAGYGMKEALDGSEPEGHPTAEDIARFEGMLRETSGSGDLKSELAGLPDFITEDHDVREQLVRWQADWVEKSTTAKGNRIKAYRVDTVKHVEETTWQHFKNELVKLDPAFRLIGEHWGANYNDDGGHFYNGTMDALLDFGFKSYARALANGNLEQANEQLTQRNVSLNSVHTLGQFLGSHDEEGFLYSLEGDEAKYKVAVSAQLTSKGQPVIYYGEELGQTGANNWPQYDNRYDFDWDAVESNDILAHYQTLLAFRNDFSPILSKGTRETLLVDNDLGQLVVKRVYNGEAVYLGFNPTLEQQMVTLKASTADVEVTDHYSNQQYQATMIEDDYYITFAIPASADGGTALLRVSGGELLSTDVVVEDPPAEKPVEEGYFRFHFSGLDADHLSELGLWTWDDVEQPSENWPLGALSFNEAVETAYGHYLDVSVIDDAKKIGFLINNNTGQNVSSDLFVDILSPDMNEVWVTETFEIYPYEPLNNANQLRVNYNRTDDVYDGWALWTWGDVVEPTDGWPNGAHDFKPGKYGVYYDLPIVEDASSIGFLTLNKTSSDQSEDMSHILDHHTQIFIREDDPTVYKNPYFVIEEGLLQAELIALDTIELGYSAIGDWSKDELLNEIAVETKGGDAVMINDVVIEESTNTIKLKGAFKTDDAPYTVRHLGREAIARAGWKLKDHLYGYEGDLGLVDLDNGQATIKVWSPSAEHVDLVLYDKDTSETVIGEYAMTRQDRGVYEIVLTEDMTNIQDHTGYFYHFKITRGDTSVLALDPYARSMAQWTSEGNDDAVGKAAIVDVSTIGPELDYAEIDGFNKREDAIIYEIHVRDFTSDPSIADDLTHEFGTFSAFVEKLDYIESLGVTHIQLLPVMSYFFSDEFNKSERLLDYSSTNNNYNWGYDPHSYFSLTGMYSEDPSDPAKRIEEFKNLIDEIHERGMGVILDVVYNHTARVHIFEDLEPNYYHFMDKDAQAKTSFGGGRLGTTHMMARRVLVDSITYWVDEFKVDGFRFDMMGDHDAESIQIAYDEAKKLNPNIIMIGEGWRTFAGDDQYPNVKPADQDWMKDTESVGSFSDEFRNELKSGFGSEGQPRFLTGGPRSIDVIFNNIIANPGNFEATNPGDVVPYIAAHDNLTLHDVIAQSIKKDPKDHQEEIHQRIRMGNLMVLTSQGTPFIHAGQEFGRTKQFRHPDYKGQVDVAPYKSTFMTSEDGTPFEYPYFIHDSYDSTDIINKIDWERATNSTLYPIQTLTRDYTTGLIQLRRSTDAFSKGTVEEVREHVTRIEAPEIKSEDLVIAYEAKASTGESYHVFINADNVSRQLTVDTDYRHESVIVDAVSSGIEAISQPTGVTIHSSSITLDPLTAVIIRVGEQEDKPDYEDNTPPEDDDKPGQGDQTPPVDDTKPGINDGVEEVTEENIKTDKETNVSVIEVVNRKGAKVSVEVLKKLAEHTLLSIETEDQKVFMRFPLDNVLSRALDANEELIVRIDQRDKKDLVVGRGITVLSDIYDFQVYIGGEYVDGVFDIPIEVSFIIDPEAVSNPDWLTLVYIDDEGNFTYYPIESYDAQTGEVKVFINHFSEYFIAEVDPAVIQADQAGESMAPSDPSDNDEPEEKSTLLPNTATHMYLLMLLGLMLALLAGTALVFKNKRVS